MSWEKSKNMFIDQFNHWKVERKMYSELCEAFEDVEKNVLNSKNDEEYDLAMKPFHEMSKDTWKTAMDSKKALKNNR